MERARGLFGDIFDVVGSLVDVLAEPVGPGKPVAFHVTKFFAGRLEADAGRGGVAQGTVRLDHAEPAIRPIISAGIGRARLAALFTAGTAREGPAIRACLLGYFLAAARFGQLGVASRRAGPRCLRLASGVVSMVWRVVRFA